MSNIFLTYNFAAEVLKFFLGFAPLARRRRGGRGGGGLTSVGR